MKAMILQSISDFGQGSIPLVYGNLPDPVPSDDEVLIRVSRCGVCHTELDEIEGRTPPPVYPVIPGHQVIGTVEAKGRDVRDHVIGDRVGVGWIFSSCGKCSYCLSGRENLCTDFRATGRDANGGYAEYMTVRGSFAYPIPAGFSDSQAAPLLCAGAVGYRALKLTGLQNGQDIGLTGFGGSGHLVLKVIRHKYPDSGIYVFARSATERAFAMELGASWAGDTSQMAPVFLDSIIDTTPVWMADVAALNNLKPGGRLVINVIRKEAADKDALLGIGYSKHLWMEKEIKSVANVTRTDVKEFLEICSEIPVIPDLQEYRLEDANVALTELKERKIRGAKVLVIK